MKKKLLITGAAGFIGFHLSKKLLEKNYEVIGFDNLNSYYDIHLKEARLKQLTAFSKENNYRWEFIKGDLENYQILNDLFEKNKCDLIKNYS